MEILYLHLVHNSLFVNEYEILYKIKIKNSSVTLALKTLGWRYESKDQMLCIALAHV